MITSMCGWIEVETMTVGPYGIDICTNREQLQRGKNNGQDVCSTDN